MREIAERALNAAQVYGASYADVRVLETVQETVRTRNGVVRALQRSESVGFGVRVVADGAWGFASSPRLSLAEAESVARQAVDIARSSALFKREDVQLGAPVRSQGQYRTPVEEDPFAVSLEDKVALLLQADVAMQQPQVTVREANLVSLRKRQVFASSEGSYIEQEIIEAGGGIEALAVGEGEVQRRSYPNSFGRNQACRGFEFIREMDLPGNAGRIAEEAVMLLTAPPCPEEVTTLILGPTQLALQVHESCGHPTELDRALGSEAAFAGTSFLSPNMLGSFRYGSDIVTLTADATVPGGLGTFGYDDEGVPAQRSYLVREGTFVGYLMSRETAATLGLSSNGAMRASGWNRLPLVRMTNINLEPGEWELDDLLADSDGAIYMEMNRSWSIDDKRLNFQFGTEVAYRVAGGKLSTLYRNPIYTGITPEFWRSCDAICNRRHWQVWGTPNCGKGQPGQVAHVGHGVAPARFRNVQVRPGR
ncbi:MAG: TldD/PmbA family protein [Anaerolineae bacterium]